MKRYVLKIILLSWLVAGFAQNYDTENYAYSQLDNYYKAQSWALVIEKGEAFLEKYPFTVHDAEVSFFLAESYYHLDVFSLSQQLLENILSDENVDKEIEKKAMYRLGLILSMQAQHEQALVYLHKLVANPFSDGRDKNVLLYSARSLSALRRAEELTVVIEYYIKEYGNNTIPLEVEPLLGSLWLGLGIDAYDGKRYAEALGYFERADLQKVEGDESPVHYEQSGLYQAVIHYLEDKTDLALHILEDRLNYDGSVSFEYTSLLAIIYGEKSNIEKSELYAKQAIEVFEKMPQKYDHDAHFFLLQSTVYQYAYILYERNEYSSAVSLIDTFENYNADFPYYIFSDNLILLKAQSLYKNGDTDKALSIFRQDFPESAETVKALFLSNLWHEGVDIALKTNDEYLQAFAHYYLRDWEIASETFISSLETSENAKSDWAQYYAGIANFYSSDFSKSLDLLQDFLRDNPYHEKAWDAFVVSAICSIEQGNIQDALDYSMSAVRSSKNAEQRQVAAVFAAGLYIDEKQYKEANALLLEFSTSSDVRSIAPRMLLAQTYASMGNINQADTELKRIVTQFPNNVSAREAAYRRGELYFENGNYPEAEKLFKEFRFSYPVGTYSDFALFGEAESRKNQQDIQGSILLYTDLVNRYGDSSYRFASMSQLVVLHRQLQEYETALSIANKAQMEYPSDFLASSLVEQRSELAVLVSGVDEEIAKVQFEWEKAGKNEYSNGRDLAYDLALLYVQNIRETDKALEILHDLNNKLQSTNEYELHANVYQLLGRIARDTENCVEAARYYLEEVRVLASVSQSQEESARALYAAIEAFDCAGMIADAHAVYDELEKNYSDSVWYKRANTILRIE